MNPSTLLIPVFLPLAAGVLIFLLAKAWKGSGAVLSLAATAGMLAVSAFLFGKEGTAALPWAGFGLDFVCRLMPFNGFILAAVSFFAFCTALYSISHLKGNPIAPHFFGFLMLSAGFAAGAVIADHLVLLLFFWEGLLGSMYGLIAMGRKDAWRTAIKMFVIVGVSDLCMMAGIAMTGHAAGSLVMSSIHLPVEGLNILAFLLLAIGGLAKAGSMPFHSWIPFAAEDAPLPFMAFFPGALEKLVGIYFLARLSLDLYSLQAGSWVSLLLMSVGAVTILLAVLMALIQKDYKKLLSYHAISQVGYMVLGIGTASAVGVIGGLFHMLNNALYKSGLFLTAGMVEKQAGTTDLRELGGLGRRMPLTAAAFVVFGLSISGVPPFNGFFSKELVYDAALERHWVFYLAAVLGSFFTAASFLKLGHAAFFGPAKPEHRDVREAPWPMLLPTLVIAGLCVLFGVYNTLPVHRFLAPAVGEEALAGHHVSGMPANWMLVAGTLIVLAAALLNHWYGVKRSGAGLGAADHIHHAPGLSGIYDRAERQAFDPYNHWTAFIGVLSRILNAADRGVNALYDVVSVSAAKTLSAGTRRLQSGAYTAYILWSMAGLAAAAWWMFR